MSLLVPTFAKARAAKGCKRRNRDTCGGCAQERMRMSRMRIAAVATAVLCSIGLGPVPALAHGGAMAGRFARGGSSGRGAAVRSMHLRHAFQGRRLRVRHARRHWGVAAFGPPDPSVDDPPGYGERFNEPRLPVWRGVAFPDPDGAEQCPTGRHSGRGHSLLAAELIAPGEAIPGGLSLGCAGTGELYRRFERAPTGQSHFRIERGAWQGSRPSSRRV